MTTPLDRLKAIRKVVGLPKKALLALAADHDPFAVGTPTHQMWGRWYAELFEQHGMAGDWQEITDPYQRIVARLNDQADVLIDRAQAEMDELRRDTQREADEIVARLEADLEVIGRRYARTGRRVHSRYADRYADFQMPHRPEPVVTGDTTRYLYASGRGFIEQLEHYRAAKGLPPLPFKDCVRCGERIKSVTARLYCGQACRQAAHREAA